MCRDSKILYDTQVNCFKTADGKLNRKISYDLFKLGDALAEDSHMLDLERTMENYHKMAVQQFHTTQKVHYMRKIPSCIKQHQQAWSCFAPERKHQGGKKVAKHSYRNCNKTMLAHDLISLRQAFSDPWTYEPNQLKDECHLEGLESIEK